MAVKGFEMTLFQDIMPEVISDDVIELKARINHDLDEEYFQQINQNREFLRQYLLWVDKTNSLDDCIAATKMFTEEWSNGKIFGYSLVLKASNKLIGSIDLHNISKENYKAEIGYWLAQHENGKGFISRAVKLIEKAAFDLGLHRIEIEIQKDNLPSIRVAERNNYILEGSHKDALYKYGQFYDKLVFAKINNS